MGRLKRELEKLELPKIGTNNKLQRGLREKQQLQGIDINDEFENEEERVLRGSYSLLQCESKFDT